MGSGKVEDRVPPLLQQSRFDKWIERACFQYHHPTSAPVVSLPVRESAAASEILFEQAQRYQKIPYSLYDGNPMTIRVINALVRLVHGGRGMEDSKQFKDPKTLKVFYGVVEKSRRNHRNVEEISRR